MRLLVPRPVEYTLLEGSEPVEESILRFPRSLLARNFHLARCKEEESVHDWMHLAVQRVSQAGAEIHHPLGEVIVGALKV